MIVFDLKCSQTHVFEAWFASSQAYEDQRQRGLIACPVCGSAEVDKAVMAPAVAPKGNSRKAGAAQTAPAEPEASPATDAPVPMHNVPLDPGKMKAVMQALAAAQASALEKSDWVGSDFSRRARAMHYGEEDHRQIHGQSTPEEAQDLIEEGVAVSPLLFPVVPPDAKN
ncbi:MAG: DUF1178 family protein [Blastomonas sp.]